MFTILFGKYTDDENAGMWGRGRTESWTHQFPLCMSVCGASTVKVVLRSEKTKYGMNEYKLVTAYACGAE